MPAAGLLKPEVLELNMLLLGVVLLVMKVLGLAALTLLPNMEVPWVLFPVKPPKVLGCAGCWPPKTLPLLV